MCDYVLSCAKPHNRSNKAALNEKNLFILRYLLLFINEMIKKQLFDMKNGLDNSNSTAIQ